MRRFLPVFAVLALVLRAPVCLAQGESAVPFLLITPYAEANGMGEASVAVLTDDPLALAMNPAHLGNQARRTQLSAGYNHAEWFPRFQRSDHSVTAYALSAGVNLKERYGIGPDVSVGLAYSRIKLDLGTFVVTGPDGPEPIATYHAYEASDQYSIGANVHSWVDFSAGMTLKHVLSKIAPPMEVQGRYWVENAVVGTFDYGFLLQIPVMEIISRLRDSPPALSPSLAPAFGLSLGLARSNLGDNTIAYISGDPGDPLPRTARVGIGLNAGLLYEKDAVLLRPIGLQWSVEANDILVRRIPWVVDSNGVVLRGGGWEYQGGLGDIRFFDELIAGHSNPRTVKKKGWQIELFEFLTLRGGRLEEDVNYGGRRFSTSGFGLRFAGVAKLIKLGSPSRDIDGALGFFVDHVDIRYNRSSIDADGWNNVLQGTVFESMILSISM